MLVAPKNQGLAKILPKNHRMLCRRPVRLNPRTTRSAATASVEVPTHAQARNHFLPRYPLVHLSKRIYKIANPDMSKFQNHGISSVNMELYVTQMYAKGYSDIRMKNVLMLLDNWRGYCSVWKKINLGLSAVVAGAGLLPVEITVPSVVEAMAADLGVSLSNVTITTPVAIGLAAWAVKHWIREIQCRHRAKELDNISPEEKVYDLVKEIALGKRQQ